MDKPKEPTKPKESQTEAIRNFLEMYKEAKVINNEIKNHFKM
jgi:hypothetical protein